MAIEMAIKKQKEFSIAEARDKLARLVHCAENGQLVEITRRGKAVAVLLSLKEYQRLVGRTPPLWKAIEEFREVSGIGSHDLEPDEVFAVDRKADRDREVEL